jgi:fatty acid desaturase
MTDRQADPIPGRLNVALALTAAAVALALLWVATHAGSWPPRLAAALLFSFVGNTIFSLLHEAVHGIFHPNRRVNEAFGRLTAAFFPTALTFQRICHLGHHQRNRTDAELFDYYKQGDNKFLKFVQWYGILTGLYWTLSPLGCLAYLVRPRFFEKGLFRDDDSVLAQQTGADAMLSGFEKAPKTLVRLEILLTIVIQAAIVLALDLTFAGWILCYAAFGFNWSSLQYADHAWSERDVRDGAWNLKVNKLVQYVFLNYHHHLAHHQHPNVPWLHLSKYVDFSGPRPSFLKIYLSMWRGPRPYPEELDG